MNEATRGLERVAGRLMRRLLDQHSPWRRRYDEGFAGGISIAAAYVDRLVAVRSASIVTRADIEDVAHRIRGELTH